MDSFRVELFGKFSVRCDDRVIEGLEAGKVQELFGYLLLHHQRPHAREALAGLLWGDTFTTQSKKYLRQALWHLQTLLDKHGHPASTLVLNDSNWIELNPSVEFWLDAEAFEQAFKRVQGVPGHLMTDQQAILLHESIPLYRGDLLEGWYQDWCSYERERYQQMYLSMLEKLIDHCKAYGAYEFGLDFGMRILRCDRARESAHQRLMYLYYMAGDRAAALRQFERCAAALEEELGVKPSKSTLALYERIQSDQFDSPTVLPHPSPAIPVGLPDMLGRLRQLLLALSDLQHQVEQEIQAVERTLAS